MRHQPLLPKTTQNHRVTPVTPDSESPIGGRYIIVSARGVTGVTLGFGEADTSRIADNRTLSSISVIYHGQAV